ncbi:unnamed protein product [Musa hybrid cultivar]
MVVSTCHLSHTITSRTYDMVCLEQRGPSSPFKERVAGYIWTPTPLRDMTASSACLLCCDPKSKFSCQNCIGDRPPRLSYLSPRCRLFFTYFLGIFFMA